MLSKFKIERGSGESTYTSKKWRNIHMLPKVENTHGNLFELFVDIYLQLAVRVPDGFVITSVTLIRYIKTW